MGQETHAIVRTEKKYEISPEKSAILVRRLSKIMEKDSHSRDCGYIVRSMYFDSAYDDDYFDKVNGLESRKKIRLRIYSPAQQWVKLEIKQKQGAVQVKKTMAIPHETALELMRGKFTPLLQQEGEFPKYLYGIMSCGLYRPKCIIEYKRTAFTARTNDTRITIDTDIRASKNCSHFFEQAVPFITLLKQPVLEVKYNGFLLDPCKEAVNMADIPEMSFSKYEMARQAAF